MTATKPHALHIDAELQARLSALAERSGSTASELAESILLSHLDEAEREIAELAEDERRWQRYLETGASVPFETVQVRLRELAAEAAVKAKRQ